MPLRLLDNVLLDEKPTEVLSVAPRELTCFVLPGYGIRGIRTALCCLRYTRDAQGGFLNGTPTTLFFTSIGALRLQKPLQIEVGGQFTLGKDEDLIEAPQSFHLTSAWQPRPSARYNAEDITAASEIARRLLDVRCQVSNRGSRLESALVYFSQVTTGLVGSLQLAYVGLWASLEALFVPQGDGKAKTIAARIARFLQSFDFTVDLESWIESEYARRRNSFAHGQHRVSPWAPGTDPAPQAFGRLHEIARLCLLGFLCMDEARLQTLQRSKRGDLQCALSGLQSASGRFLEGQVAWLDG